MVRLDKTTKKTENIALSPSLKRNLTEIRIGNLLRKNPSGLRFTDLVEGTSRTKKTVAARLKDWLQKGYVRNHKRLYILTPKGADHLEILHVIPSNRQLSFDRDVILFKGTKSMATTVFIGYSTSEAEKTYEKLTETLGGANVHGSIIFKKPEEKRGQRR